ncbi:helix-turn-helix domain-containing protein [Gimesia aquarii]|uniref:Helix-turn-helix domain protein n=1 Tax=Gimesia aquarii TaxID=2527964 RepID=A0A517VQI3_9PLAN|nr:helix-turn-helix domain-containing protein [Gimesia aquarii]QDT95285.1 Helix-turn-helix domain protein [Gimesia aquarii]
MSSDLESAFRVLLKLVVQEVVDELQSRRQFINHMNSEQGSGSDDRLLLRAKEVAERLAISERHLHKMTTEGAIPCVRIGQSVRYRVETVKDWLREAESTETPQTKQQVSKKKKSIITKQPKITRKAKQKKVVEQKAAMPTQSETVEKQKNVQAKKRRPNRAEPESEQERPNPFRLLLKEIGVDREKLGPLTNEELIQIADVDLPTFHGWMYKGHEMPEEALEKLRKHFSIGE